MAVSVTLRQEKKVFTDTFLAVSTITGASPSGYFPIFVLSENGGDPTSERFDRVATINDTALMAENPLTRFQSTAGGIFTAAVPTDTITILNAPETWFETFFTQAKFTIVAVSGGLDRVDVSGTLPFPTALGNANWELRSAFGTLKAQGTGNARAIRNDLAITTFLRRHMNLTFADVKRASDHVNAVSTFVQDLIDDLNVDVDAFTGIETEVVT